MYNLTEMHEQTNLFKIFLIYRNIIYKYPIPFKANKDVLISSKRKKKFKISLLQMLRLLPQLQACGAEENSKCFITYYNLIGM